MERDKLAKDRLRQAAKVHAAGTDIELVEDAYGYQPRSGNVYRVDIDDIPETACEGCGEPVTYRTAFYIEDTRFCRSCRAALFVVGSELSKQFAHFFGEE